MALLRVCRPAYMQLLRYINDRFDSSGSASAVCEGPHAHTVITGSTEHSGRHTCATKPTLINTPYRGQATPDTYRDLLLCARFLAQKFLSRSLASFVP